MFLRRILTRAALTLLAVCAASGCGSRCLSGFVERDGVCVDPSGDGSLPLCNAAPSGKYEGTTDQGLPVSFEINEERTRAVEFAIDVVLVGDGENRPTHQVRVPAGLPMRGCAFAGVIVNSEFSGSFLPPRQFVGAYYDVFNIPGTMTYLPQSGQWTASLVAPLDGGVPDGALLDGGPPTDAGESDAGAPTDAGPAADGGVSRDGGAPADIALPTGFVADVLATGVLGPFALALDPTSGSLYVAEYFAGEVARIAPEGTRTSIAAGLVLPSGVSIVGAGTPSARLFVSHAGGLVVQSLAGGAPQTFGPALAFTPGPLSCAEPGVCHAVELSLGRRSQAVWRVTSNEATLVAGADAGIDQPFGLASAGANVVVTEANLGFPSADGVLLHELDADGGVAAIQVSLLAQPGPIAALRTGVFAIGEMVLSSGGGRRVFVWDRAAQTTRPFASGFVVPAALAFDETRSTLYVADLARGAIYRIRGPFEQL